MWVGLCCYFCVVLCVWLMEMVCSVVSVGLIVVVGMCRVFNCCFGLINVGRGGEECVVGGVCGLFGGCRGRLCVGKVGVKRFCGWC